MATNHNFRIKNGLEVGGTVIVSSDGVMTIPTNSTGSTQDGGTNNTRLATTAFVQQEITSLIGGAPGSLDTLNELAAAINDDASYASTLTTALATKLPLAGGTITSGTSVGLTINHDTFGAGLRIHRNHANNAPSIQFLNNSGSQGTLFALDSDDSLYWRIGTSTTNNKIFHDAYHPNADKWTSSRTLTLAGDLSGNVSFDGSANFTLTATVADDSHNHVISNVDGLQSALDAKAPLASPSFTSKITTPQIHNNNTISVLNGSAAQGIKVNSLYAGTSYSNSAPSGMVNALNGFQVANSTVINSSGNWVGGGNISEFTNNSGYITASSSAVTNKLPLAGGTMTGAINAGGGINGLTLSNGISGNNFNITGVNQLTINDPGEGIVFGGGSTTMSLAIVDDATDRILRYSGTGAVFDVQGNITLTGTVTATGGNSTNWNTAHGWGNHASAGYITASSSAVTNKLPLAGGTMTGKLTLNDAGYSLGNEYHKWKRAYTVNTSSPQEILYSDGNSLPTGGVYRFTAHISGTGTDQFATAVYWNQNGTWRINVTGQSGTSSNHPEFIIDGTTNKPTIHIDHTSSYGIHILGERIELDEGTGTDNAGYAFGTDAFLGSVNNNLYFLPGGSAATGQNSYDDGNVVWHTGNLTTTNKANYDTAVTVANAALPKAGGTMTGQVEFPSSVSNRPVLTGGFLSRQTSDGDADIWGISETYYPSEGTAANAWGIRWASSPNHIQFVGANANKVTFDLDNGAINSVGVITASGGNSANWNTAYTTANAALPKAGGTITGNLNVNGTTTLGNGPSDQTHINDTLYLGATDSGDSHFYFGENSSNWYGDHWYWDSGHEVERYSRHAGTDTLIEKHNTQYTHKVQTNRAYERLGHATGYQIGSYNSVAANSTKTNPIYTIGDNYRPSDTSVSGMYGIGYAHSNLWGTGSGKTSGWGQYVVEAGAYTQIFSVGGTWSLGEFNRNGNKVWDAGNDGSGSGLDADTVDGLHKDFLMHYKGQVSGDWDTIFSQTDGHMGVYQVTNTTGGGHSNYPTTAYSYGGVLSWQLADSTFKLYAPHTGQLHYQTGWNNDEYSGWRKIWDTGNDGSGSGLDADLLDGQHASAFIQQNTGNLIDLFANQNGTNELRLDNNRQDSGNVPISKVSGRNSVEVANMTFYRGGGGSSGFIRFQNKPTNAASLTDVFQVGDGGTVGYGVDILAGGLRIGGNEVINSSRVMTIPQIKLGDGNDGYFYSDTNGRTAFANGDFYIQNSVSNYYNYATNQYIGDSSGDNIYFRSNVLSGTGWGIDGAGKLNTRDHLLNAGYHLQRADHHSGHLEGSYNNVGGNGAKSNPIYTIGSSYNPSDAALGNMYGIGYTSTSSSFANPQTGSYNWGMYVAADGDARVWLDGSTGTIWSVDQHYVGANVVWNAGNDGAGSGLDADLLDGKDHTNFGATLATYGTTSASSGRIRCTAPFNTNSSHMFKVTVSIYTSYGQHDYVVGGYMYSTTNQWYSPTCIYTGTGSPDIVVGRDSNGKAYISIANGNYTGVRVHSMTLGYYTSVADTYDPWTITINGATENSVTPTKSKVWHSTNDASGSGLDADLLDGQQGSYYAPATGGTYLPLAGGNITGAQIAFTASSNGDKKLNFSGHGGASGYNYFLGAANDGGNKAVMFVNGSSRTADGGINTFTIRNDAGPINVGRSNQTTKLLGSGSLLFNGNTVWHAGNDGSGSGLDADTVDGIHGASLLRSDADDSFSGGLTSTSRDEGIFGTYDSTKTDHIWSMGTAYKNHASGTNFGNLYGLAYKHTNNTTGGTMGGSHQVVWCHSGDPRGAIGYDYVWHTSGMRVGSNTVWHAGNDGAGSGLDADNLDGVTWATQTKAVAARNWTTEAGDGQGLTFWGGTGTALAGSYAIAMSSQGNSNAGRMTFETTSDYNMYFKMSGGTNRGFVFKNGSSNVLNIDGSGHLRANSVISSSNRQAMNCAHWSASGTSTGAVKITLPGSAGSVHSMPIIKIYTYQYSSTAHVVYTISGHDWSTASNWYNNRVTSEGGPPLAVRLGHDGTNYCIIIGETNTSWSYGSATVELKAHPSYYNANQNFTTGWTATQITSMPSTVTAQTVGKIWDSSNDASGSGLDADLLDGVQGTSYLRSDAADTASGAISFTGGHGAINITNSSILSSPTSTWTGNPGGAGKIQYHSNRWYIVSDSSSNRIVQFRKDGADQSYIANNGNFVGNVTGNATGSSGSCTGNAATVTQNHSDGNGSYPILWKSGSTTYYTDEVFINASTNSIQAFKHICQAGTDNGIGFWGGHSSYAIKMGDNQTNHGTVTDYSMHHMMGTTSGRGFTFGSSRTAVTCSINALTGAILSSNNITAYSDIRVKDNIEVIPNALDKIKQLSGYTFTRTDVEDKEQKYTGVIAQEVLKVLPEAVQLGATEEDTMSVAYGNMVGLLIESIKELKAEVDDLKTQLSQKEN